jgi:hypothetical protein
MIFTLLKRIVAVEWETPKIGRCWMTLLPPPTKQITNSEVAHALILLKHPTRLTDFAILRPKSGNKVIVTKGWLSHLLHQYFGAGKECFLAFQKLSQKHGAPATPEI